MQAVLDDAKEEILALTGEAGIALEAYAEGATLAQREWMESEGKQLLADAKKSKSLPSVKVPVCAWHKAGLAAAIAILQQVLETLGGRVAEEAAKVKLDKPSITSVELRRNMDQLVQHFVMDKVQQAIFPKVRALRYTVLSTPHPV